MTGVQTCALPICFPVTICRGYKKMGGVVTIDNVLGTIWAAFSAIITMYIAVPFWNLLFGNMQWNNMMMMYALEIIWVIFFFTILLIVPLKIFMAYKEKSSEEEGGEQ